MASRYCSEQKNLPTQTATKENVFTTLRAELKARQATETVGSNTCGWIAGNPISSVTCPSGYGCGAFSTFVGCSPNAIYTTCYDRLGPTCDSNCQLSSANLYCGNSYCAQFNYPSGSVGYGCATSSGYTNTVLLYTTSATTSDLKVGVTSTLTPTETGATPTQSSQAVPSSKSSSLSAGAIAGIVIGSIATILIICGFIFMVYAHRKKQSQALRDEVSRKSAMSLMNTGSATPSSQAHPHHLSGTTYYEKESPPFDPGNGPWSTPHGYRRPKSTLPPGELEGDY